MKNSVDDDTQLLKTTRKNNHSVTSPNDQAFVGTTPTHKSFRRKLHMPVKKILHQEKNIFVLKYMMKVLMLNSATIHVC